MIFAANFKTNHTRKSTKAYLDDLRQKIAAKRAEDKVYIFPLPLRWTVTAVILLSVHKMPILQSKVLLPER